MATEGKKTERLLEVNNLEVEFKTESGRVKAVDDVSFSLNKGETIGIVGESGSGKSVTSLSIMQLISSPPGKVRGGDVLFQSGAYGEIDLLNISSAQKRHIRGNEISMIFQEPMTSLNPVYTCGNQVNESLMLHWHLSYKKATAITLDLFNKVRLPRPKDIFKAYPHQISGGQKQRVMIAMALACNPSVLIADEPTTALDVTVQAAILDLMRDLRDNDSSIIFITHDLGVIAEIADRILVMYQGKIVEQGPVWDIFVNPKHPYTKGLLACRPRLDIKLNRLPVVSDFMERDAAGGFKTKDADNNKEKFATIGEAILKHYITEEETKARIKKLESNEPHLKVKHLKTYFPIHTSLFGKPKEVVKAVDDVSFEVYPDETVGLVGESGCGKTTLGRTILRLIEPTDGEIILQGTRINEVSKKHLRRLRKDMQIIFQDPYSSLNPRIPIGEAIMEPMKVHGILKTDLQRKKRVAELLEQVQLDFEHYMRYPHEFSGGQRQRICIARALALNPKFIICDESVSALDVSVQAQVLNLLNQLRDEYHFTCIFISHDLSVVKFMSDRLIVMNNGKIEEQGYADEIYENPQTAYTRKLIDAIPKGDIEEIRARKNQ